MSWKIIGISEYEKADRVVQHLPSKDKKQQTLPISKDDMDYLDLQNNYRRSIHASYSISKVCCFLRWFRSEDGSALPEGSYVLLVSIILKKALQI